MRSLFWASIAVLIAWTVAFGGYTYSADVNLAQIVGIKVEEHLLVRISLTLIWIGGILLFGLLALILKPTAREL